jgi:hypothetical protein
MHHHLQIRHWVVWSLYFGVVCGVVALINILARNMSSTQDIIVLLFGALFWLLAGIACYGYDGVKIELPARLSGNKTGPPTVRQREWRAASEFVLPGTRKSMLPPKY